MWFLLALFLSNAGKFWVHFASFTVLVDVLKSPKIVLGGCIKALTLFFDFL